MIGAPVWQDGGATNAVRSDEKMDTGAGVMRSWLRNVGASVVAVALLLLAGCTGHPSTVEPVDRFDAARYQGVWYEIMRLDHSFERGLTNVTATYELRDDGKVGVLNRGFNRAECRWEQVEGIAVFQGDEDVASLSVTFFWPFTGGYHVFALDRQDYGYAVVSGPTYGYLWILARQPDLPADIRDALVADARDRGFPADQLILVDHSQPPCLSEETG